MKEIDDIPQSTLPPQDMSESEESSQLFLQERYRAIQFQGPIPPPKIFEQYEQAVPGSADRIIKLAEQDQVQDHSMEKQGQSTHHTLLLRGQGLSFATAIVAMICGTALIAIGSETVGSVMAIGSLATCAALYIRGEFRNRGNRGNV